MIALSAKKLSLFRHVHIFISILFVCSVFVMLKYHGIWDHVCGVLVGLSLIIGSLINPQLKWPIVNYVFLALGATAFVLSIGKLISLNI